MRHRLRRSGWYRSFLATPANLYNATEFRPDTIGSVGGSRVSPYDGTTVAATDPITRPLRIGNRNTTMYYAGAAATNLIASSSDYTVTPWTLTACTTAPVADGYTEVTSTGSTMEQRTTSFGVTSGNRLWATVELKPGSATWVRVILLDGTTAIRASTWVNLAAGTIGTQSAAGTGAIHGGAFLVRRADGSFLLRMSGILGTVTSASVRIYVSDVDGSVTKPTGVTYLARHVTMTNGEVFTGAIPTTGSTASITADNIRRATLDIFPTGSPRLSQPWTMSWWVMMEGHDIGATGHVSGVLARHWDHNTASYMAYSPSVNQQTQTALVDSAASQQAVSASGAAPDVSGTLVAYVMTYEPNVALRVYRNRIKIADDLTVGSAITAWTAAMYLGNRAALDRALSGWMSAPHFLFGTALSGTQIAAQYSAGASAP